MATNKPDIYVYAHWLDLILRGGLPVAVRYNANFNFTMVNTGKQYIAKWYNLNITI